MAKKSKKTRGDLHSHLLRRLGERYNLLIGVHEIERVIDDIRENRSYPLGKVSNRISNHVVLMRGTDLATFEGKSMYVAVGYDRKRGALTTALPAFKVDQVEGLPPIEGGENVQNT